MIWYKELGYAYNPFIIKPGFFDDEVIGYDKEIETLITWLKSDSMCFLEAEYGLGKSTILKFIINEFKDEFRLAHISRNRSDRAFNYEKLLVEANKGLGKLFGKKAKEVILIIDETEKLNEKESYLYTLKECEKLHKQKSPFVTWVEQGDLIGYTGSSGLIWGELKYSEEKLNIIKPFETWDEVHLHYEEAARDEKTFLKKEQRDPYSIYKSAKHYKKIDSLNANLFI